MKLAIATPRRSLQPVEKLGWQKEDIWRSLRVDGFCGEAQGAVLKSKRVRYSNGTLDNGTLRSLVALQIASPKKRRGS